jgi:uncharacterized repeat protein (TIGR01451 family)
VGSLPPGASATFTLVVSIIASTGSLTNTATVSTTTSEPNPNNNTTIATTTIGGADITITKSAPGTALVNSLLTYTLSVRNQGTANAADVVVSDTLPAGLQFVSTSAPCTQALGVVTCDLGTVAPSGEVDLSIQATVIAPSGTITNTATVSTSSPETNTTNNTSSASTAVLLLSVTKTAGPDPVLLNGTLTYTLSVTNVGTSTVPDITIVDNLPFEVNFLSATGNCTQQAKQLVCNIGSLAPGGSAGISIQTTVTAPYGTIINSAFANSGGQPASNTATVQTQIAAPDLSLTKTAAPYAATNSMLAYDLTATNRGTAPAASVMITDTLPAGVQFVESSPNCTFTTCDLGTLGPGMSATVRITVKVTASNGILNNRANVSSSTPELDTSNNDASYTTSIAPADLTISNTAPGGPIPVGSNATFSITVKNIGLAAADNIVVTDVMPMEFASASIPCFQNSATTVSCDLGTLSPTQETTFTVSGRVIVFAPGPQTNTATVTTTSSESNTTNNTASASVTLTGPDLMITKSADASSVLAGNNITYTLTVKNLGGADAHNVTVTDTLPSGLIFVSASPQCTIQLPSISCDLQTVVAGAFVSLTIVATVTPFGPGTITNDASVSTPDREMSTANNTATSTVTVIAADLSISVSAPDSITPLSQMDYVVNVSNIGTAGATNVIVTDVLPNGVFFGGATVCGFDSGSRTVTCSLATLPPGSTAPITIHVFVGDTSGLLTNVVTATTSTPDSNPANNSSTVSTLVF